MIDQTEAIENLTTNFEKIDENTFYMKEKMTNITFPKDLKLDFENTHIAISKNGGLMAFVKKSLVLILNKLDPLHSNVIIMCQDGSNLIVIPFAIKEKERTIILFDFNDNHQLYAILNEGSIFKFDIISQNVYEKSSGKTFLSDKIIKAKFFEKGYVCLTESGTFWLIKSLKEPFPIQFFILNMIGINEISDFIFLPPSISGTKKIELIFPNTNGEGIINVIEQENQRNFQITDPTNLTFNGIFFIRNSETELFSMKNSGFFENNSEINEDNLGKIVALAISPSKTKIAFYREDGTVFVFHSSLNTLAHKRIKTKFVIEGRSQRETEEIKSILAMENNKELKSKINYHYQFLFCGEDAVCLAGKRFVLIAKIDENQRKSLVFKIVMKSVVSAIMSSQFFYCISECDGIRILTKKEIFLIYKINKELYDTCFPFSDHPCKKLLKAFKKYFEKNANCQTEINELNKHNLYLANAINTLLKAAAQLYWLKSNQNNYQQIQIYLLKAASFGKNFVEIDQFNFNRFIEICKDIRILNNIRNVIEKKKNEEKKENNNNNNNNNEIFGKPNFITYNEYKNLQTKELIRILIKQQNFFLAFQISEYLEFNTKNVYEKFAIAKIKKVSSTATPTEEIKTYEFLYTNLKNVPNISFVNLAKKAFKYQKKEIGMKFLENENSILTKIPQYVELKKWDKAIELTFETYDSNIILSVIDKIFKKEDFGDFINILSKFPKIDKFVIDYLKKNSPKDLDVFLIRKFLIEDLFFLYLDRFFNSNELKDRLNNLNKAKTLFKNLENYSNFDIKFYKNYINDLEKSLILKKDYLEKDLIKKDDQPFDISIYDVYKTLISNKNDLETINKNFDLGPKKISILKIRTYYEINNFTDLNKIASTNPLKKVNLTPLALAELYFDNKNYDKVVEYIKQINDNDSFEYKVNILLYIEKYLDAVEVIITDKYCNRKELMIHDILNRKPELKHDVKRLCEKFKFFINI